MRPCDEYKSTYSGVSFPLGYCLWSYSANASGNVEVACHCSDGHECGEPPDSRWATSASYTPKECVASVSSLMTSIRRKTEHISSLCALMRKGFIAQNAGLEVIESLVDRIQLHRCQLEPMISDSQQQAQAVPTAQTSSKKVTGKRKAKKKQRKKSQRKR